MKNGCASKFTGKAHSILKYLPLWKTWMESNPKTSFNSLRGCWCIAFEVNLEFMDPKIVRPVVSLTVI